MFCLGGESRGICGESRGICGERVGDLDQGLEGWCYVCEL